ncbi:MAG: efflux RND transporter periplasmic adaptor subunit [Rhodomicrobiaceae bacterium]
MTYSPARQVTAASVYVLLAIFAAFMQNPLAAQSADDAFLVAEREIDDFKAVFATVDSKDRVEARVRTPGTVAELKVDEGAQVEPGQLLAVVADPKIALSMNALDAQITGLESRVETARTDLSRAEQLAQRGVVAQARLDELRTAFDTANNDLKARRAERSVLERQIEEGQVLAPAEGRVLRVPVTVGSVMMAGETIATIAANEYLLRLELPERHARFMKQGDPIRVGARGLASGDEVVSEGRIVQVYPELAGGRVVADAEAPGLGSYFVGERVRIWISAGKRKTIIVPADYVFRRHGLDYVKVARAEGEAIDLVVQPGQPVTLNGAPPSVEILSGLRAGDRLIRP